MENLFEEGCHRRSMGNMSLTVGAEDKTKTVSCYANNLALSETKVKVSFETLTKHYWKSLHSGGDPHDHSALPSRSSKHHRLPLRRIGQLLTFRSHLQVWLLMICALRSARAICVG